MNVLCSTALRWRLPRPQRRSNLCQRRAVEHPAPSQLESGEWTDQGRAKRRKVLHTGALIRPDDAMQEMHVAEVWNRCRDVHQHAELSQHIAHTPTPLCGQLGLDRHTQVGNILNTVCVTCSLKRVHTRSPLMTTRSPADFINTHLTVTHKPAKHKRALHICRSHTNVHTLNHTHKHTRQKHIHTHSYRT